MSDIFSSSGRASESEMVVPVDLPSVKPHSQCSVRKVSSLLKLRQRKQPHFPALASLTDTECTPTAGSHILPPTDASQHLCPEGTNDIYANETDN